MSRIGEREAPDGEEEEAPQQATVTNIIPQTNPAQRQIRVPNWIDHPPVSTLTVDFTLRALFQLQQLGSEVCLMISFKLNINLNLNIIGRSKEDNN